MEMYSRTRRKAVLQWSYLSISQVPADLYGLYAFWCRDNRKCIYVGKAKERPVRMRLREHWNGSHNETLRLWIKAFGDSLDICYASVGANQVDEMERRLIRRLRPEANLVYNPKR